MFEGKNGQEVLHEQKICMEKSKARMILSLG